MIEFNDYYRHESGDFVDTIFLTEDRVKYLTESISDLMVKGEAFDQLLPSAVIHNIKTTEKGRFSHLMAHVQEMLKLAETDRELVFIVTSLLRLITNQYKEYSQEDFFTERFSINMLFINTDHFNVPVKDLADTFFPNHKKSL